MYRSMTAGSKEDFPVSLLKIPVSAKRALLETVLAWNALGAKAMVLVAQAKRATELANFILVFSQGKL